jgi:amino acid transporter
MEQKIRTADLIFFLTCNMLGTGVLTQANSLLSTVHSPAISLVLWVLSGGLSVLFGLCYAELGSTYPQAGGDCNYLGRAFSKHLALAYSLCSILVILPLGCAQMVKVIAEHFPTYSIAKTAAGILALSFVSVSLGNAVSVFTIRLLFISKIVFMVYLVAIALLSLAASKKMAGSALLDRKGHRIPSFPELILGFFHSQWPYDGWNSGNFIANRIDAPGKTFPRGIVSALILVTITYVVVNTSYMVTLPYDVILKDRKFLEPYLRLIPINFLPMPEKTAQILTISISLGTLLGSLVVGSGICESLVPHKYTKKRELGFRALFLLLVFLYAAFLGEHGIISKIGFSTSLFYTLSSTSLIILRLRHPRLDRPFKVPLAIPLICAALGSFICISSIFIFTLGRLK